MSVLVRALVLLGVGLVAVPVRAADPVKSPSRGAEESREKSQEGQQTEEEAVEVPTVRVEGQREQPSANEAVGPYDQPNWTVRRPFPGTRVYVSPPGTAEFNIFFTPEFALTEPSNAGIETEYEIDIGLGHRLQFDGYLVTFQQGWGGPYGVVEEKLELRWAFADWGEIWGNPTLYFEWAHGHPALTAASVEGAVSRVDATNDVVEFDEFESSPTSIEPKLLLSGNLSASIFGAVNLVYEQPIGGDESEREFGLSGGLAHLAVDPELFLGFDLESEMELAEGELAEYGVVAGPSAQWYPSEPVHVGLSALFGAEFEKEGGGFESEPLARPRLVIGYKF